LEPTTKAGSSTPAGPVKVNSYYYSMIAFDFPYQVEEVFFINCIRGWH
jgi:hypothetical protein